MRSEQVFFEEGYDSAPIREMKFDETYYDMHYDVQSSMTFNKKSYEFY